MGAKPKGGAAFLHAFDPAEGRSRRVHVLGFAGRRRAQPRAFTLTFTAPPPPPRPPARSPSPALLAPTKVQLGSMQPSCAPSPEAASTAKAPPEAASPVQPSVVEPADDGLHLDDLVALAFEAARARQPVVTAARTPAASLPGALESTAGSGCLIRTPARLHGTPIEGIPERFLFSTACAEPPQRCAAPAAAQAACRASSVGLTPIEGVPERLLKRPRLSAPPGTPNLAGPLAYSSPQQEQPPGGSAQVERAACGGGRPGGKPVAPIPETADTSFMASSPDGMTAADIAAAVSAAARTAMERLWPGLAGDTPNSQAPAPTTATTSHTSISTSAGRSDSVVSNGTTPALVKMHNLAAAAADAVQRAAEAMGGPPSRSAAPRPPRPTSARAGSGRWTPDVTAAGSSGQAAAALAAGNDGLTGEAEALPSLDGLIHRAKPGALLFPSRTPSPMGGVRWPPADAQPPVLTAGASAASVMVTPTLRAVDNSLPGPSCSAPGPSRGAATEAPANEACAAQLAKSTGDAAAPAAWPMGDDDAAAAWPVGANGGSDVGSDGGGADVGGKYSDQDEGAASDGRGKGGQAGPSRGAGDRPPLPSPANTEGAFADCDNDEALAMEVQALPDEPEPAARRRRSSPRRPGASGGSLLGSDSAAASERQPSHSGGDEGGERAGRQRRQTDVHAHERRLVVNRKSLAGIGLTMDEGGTRRSTRSRVRPLQYWRGEAKSYGRQHNTLPTVRAIKMRTPEPKWPRPTEPQEKAKRRARTMQAAQSAGASEDPRNE